MHDMPLKTKFVILASAFHTVIASGEIRDERKFRMFYRHSDSYRSNALLLSPP